MRVVNKILEFFDIIVSLRKKNQTGDDRQG